MADHDFVGYIYWELLQALAQGPELFPKDASVEKKLDEMFGQYDWSRSFDRRQILVHDENIMSEILPMMHTWFRRRCLDIENIEIIMPHHIGIEQYWHKWCDLNQVKSFKITEVWQLRSPLMRPVYQSMPSLQDLLRHKQHREITKLFSYYGGTHSDPEREYIACKLMPFRDRAEINFMAEPYPEEAVLAYVERNTYFKNQKEVDHIRQLLPVRRQTRLQSEATMEPRGFYEGFHLDRFQSQVDARCWACVVRESHNSDRFCSLTEKTLRALVNHLVVLPLGYQSVHWLENIGFWFPHDIVDYSYTQQPLFVDRVNGLIENITRLASRPLQELQKYHVDNLEKFQYNAKLVYEKNNTPTYIQGILDQIPCPRPDLEKYV